MDRHEITITMTFERTLYNYTFTETDVQTSAEADSAG